MNYGTIVAELRLLETICRHSGGKDEIALLAKNAADTIENLDDICQHQADEIRELKKRWIPVTERLPEDENRKYLIAISSVTKPTTTLYDICWFAKDLYEVDRFDFPDEKNKPGFYEYDSEYGFVEKTSVTHWMPLPSPPVEE